MKPNQVYHLAFMQESDRHNDGLYAYEKPSQNGWYRWRKIDQYGNAVEYVTETNPKSKTVVIAPTKLKIVK